MNELLKQALNACFYQEPLEADDPRRVDFHALGVRGTDADPMARMKTIIQTSDRATQQLFSGFIGSGKSTELRRLKAELERDGFMPVLIDAEDYLNLRVEPRVTDLLATVAAGVDAFIRDRCQGPLEKQLKPYWERFRTFLGTKIELDGMTLGVPGVADFEFTFKTDVHFKSKLYEHLENHGRLGDLAKQCHVFMNEAMAVVKGAHPGSQGLVVIVDSFEKVRGDHTKAEAIRSAVETLFVQEWKWLRLPFHVIYTVPSWLTFYEFGTAAEFGRVCILPMCRVQDRTTGERVPEGFAAMRQILEKREEFRIGEVFAELGPMDDLIEASGGYPRDFLRMMREVLLSAILKNTPTPIPEPDFRRLVEDVIREQTAIYEKPIFDDDLELLTEIARRHDVPRSKRDQAFRIAELFDNHFVLGYRNGGEWYDLHPLVRRSRKVQNKLKEPHGNETEGVS